MAVTVFEAVITRDYGPEGLPFLGHDEAVAYLAVLIRLAALDGLSVDEEDFLHRAAACVGLLPELADIAGQFVADPTISSESLIARIHDPGLRLCLLRDAYRLAALDGVFSSEEMVELSRIAAVLGLEQSVAAEVRTIALQESRLHREFAEMVRAARG